MTIPDFQSIMCPLLEHLNDGAEHTNQETRASLAAYFGLNDAEKNKLLPSGNQAVFTNRVAWAKSHLKQAGLIESTKRAVYRITPRGQKALQECNGSINMQFLLKYKEYQTFRKSSKTPSNSTLESEAASAEALTPQEQMEYGYQQIRQELMDEVLEKLKENPPQFFEKVVVDLVLAMGYGGSRSDAGEAIGKGGDEGIDGIIKEDRLGLETIYLQAKRWEGTVGRPEIQKFAGALQGHHARKGIFITTSTFTKDAINFAGKIDRKIVLIDGAELAELMIDHGVGVTNVTRYEIMRLDTDYFIAE